MFSIAQTFCESRALTETTWRGTALDGRCINFPFMAPAEKNVPAGPLLRRLASKGASSALAKKLNISAGRLTNWKRRGIPWREFRQVLDALELTEEEYRAEAGYPGVQNVSEPRQSYTVEFAALRADFIALPDGLREHVTRKTAELRRYSDALPGFLRDALKPPSDPERYRLWEREMEDAVAKWRATPREEPPPPTGPSRLSRVLGSPKRDVQKIIAKKGRQ